MALKSAQHKKNKKLNPADKLKKQHKKRKIEKPLLTAVEGDESDAVWGLPAIGREINRTPEQTRWLVASKVLDGAVKKIGHRTYLGSKRKLKEVFAAAEDVRQPDAA